MRIRNKVKKGIAVLLSGVLAFGLGTGTAPGNLAHVQAASVSTPDAAHYAAQEQPGGENTAEPGTTGGNAVSGGNAAAALNGSVQVQDNGHTAHPICGRTCDDSSHEEVDTWQPISDEAGLKNAAAGYYYLAQDVVTADVWKPGDDVVLCLNGHSITANGDFNVITVQEGYTFTLCNCQDSGEITHAAKEDGTKYTGSGVTITGNVGENGAGTFNMYSGMISGNIGTEYRGGGVDVDFYGIFTMNGGTISGNGSTNSDGGGVYVAGIFTMNGGTISGNTASGGGGIYVYGDCTMNGGTVSRNTAAFGAGAYVMCYDSDAFTMNGGTISDNTATTSNGGGVYLSKGPFTMNGGTVSGNTATGDGGGVYLGSDTCTFTMSGDATVSGNTTNANGGGVYIKKCIADRYTHTFTMSGNAKITDNKADGNGGGVMLIKETTGTLTLSVSGAPVVQGNKSGTETSNFCLPDKSTLTIAGALTDGAAIGLTTSTVPSESSTVIVATGATADYSSCFTSDAGRKYKVRYNSADSTLRLGMGDHEHYLCGGDTCDGNNHPAEAAATVFEKWTEKGSLPGSGNYYLSENVTLTAAHTLTGNLVLDLNGHSITVGGDADAISIPEGMTFTLTDCDGSGAITRSSGSGSGVDVDNSTFVMYGGKICNHAATYGGGVFLGGRSVFTMYGGEISGNTASISGGGVQVDAYAQFNMTGGTISGNVGPATESNGGGGVFIYYGGSFTMSGDARITGNKAHKGGGVYVCDGDSIFRMEGGTIGGTEAADANTATLGGGVYVKNSTFTMTGGMIGGGQDNGGNTASTNGGGVYVESGVCNMEGGTICGNTASTNGGGVYLYGGSFTMTNGTIGGIGASDDNDAVNGGGVYIDSNGVFRMDGGSSNTPNVYGNYVKGKGSGVYVGGAFEIENSVQVTGTSDDVYLPDGKTIRVTGKLTCTQMIGIMPETMPADGAPVHFADGYNYQLEDSDTQAFFIDGDYNGETYTAQRDGNTLKFYLGEPHKHLICVGADCTDESHDNVFFDALTYDAAQKQLKYGVKSSDETDGVYEISSEGCLYLTGNLELDAPILITGDVKLCLNGYSIILNADGDVIKIGKNGSLTLCDCRQNGAASAYGRITHGTGADGSQYTGHGVMMFYEQTSFNMYGGKISGNKITDSYGSGAGVYIFKSSYFNMYGGEISGNELTGWYSNGGGVCNSGTMFVGGNAKISDNHVTYGSSNGGGVYVTDDGKLTLSGSAQITDNTAYNYGGGIYLCKNAKLSVSGNVQVTGNEDGYFALQGGSNVFVYGAGTQISVTGRLDSSARIGVTLFEKICPTEDNPVTIAVADSAGWIQTGNFSSDYSAYYKLTVSEDGTAAVLQLHDHIWKIQKGSAENILRERCSVKDCNVYGGTLTLTAGDADYTGSAYSEADLEENNWSGDTPAITYEKKNSDGSFEPLTEAPVAQGSYRAVITVDGVSAVMEFSIKPGTLIPRDFRFTAPGDPVYDGQPKTAEVTLPEDKKAAAGEITVKYCDADGNIIEDESGVPVTGVTDAGTYTVKIDVTAGDGYNGVSNMYHEEWTFTITRRPVTVTGIMAKDKPYDGTTDVIFDYSQVHFEGLMDGDSLTVKAFGGFEDKNVGENKTVRISGMILQGESESNYVFGEGQQTTATADITPVELTITDMTVGNKVYDGTTEATITAAAFDGVVAGESLISGRDYTISGVYEDAAVGTGKKVTATVTLTENAKNYTLPDNSYSKGGCEISKASVDDPAAAELIIINGAAKTYTFTLPSLPALEEPKDYGRCTYMTPELTIDNADYKGTATVSEDGVLTLDITDTGAVNANIGTVKVKVGTDNYTDITLTVNLRATDKIVPQLEAGTLTLSVNEITYGAKLGTITISGTMKDSSKDVPGTFAWENPDAVLTAGTHNDVVWKFTPNDTQTYEGITDTATVKVNKAAQNGKVSMDGYTYGAATATPTLTDRTGDGSAAVTYYYSTTDTNKNGIEWTGIAPTTLNAGAYYMYAVIAETENYSAFTTPAVKFVVKQAVPQYTKPTGLTAKCGQKLGELGLTNPAGNMSGTWSWQASDTVFDKTGKVVVYAAFKPDDANYAEVTDIEIEVSVEKGDGKKLATVELTQKFADSSEHTYTPDWTGLPAGQTWSYSCEVGDGSAAVFTKQDVSAGDGALTYAISGGKVGDTLTVTLKASCNNYEDFTITLNITITKAVPTGEPKYTAITADGKTLADAGLTLTGSTISPADGTLEWVDDAGNALPGTTEVEANKTYKWRFTPTDDNYEILTGEAELYHKSTEIDPNQYKIIGGADSSWTQNTDGNLVIRGNGDFAKFQSVKVDGKVIDAKNYTVAEGSTIVTLKADYLKTLSAGSHSFEIVWTDGAAGTHFTVALNTPGNNNDDDEDDSSNESAQGEQGGNAAAQTPAASPKTGDTSNYVLWAVLLVAAVAGIAVVLIKKKKE